MSAEHPSEFAPAWRALCRGIQADPHEIEICEVIALQLERDRKRKEFQKLLGITADDRRI